jgi:hypothetical protein
MPPKDSYTFDPDEVPTDPSPEGRTRLRYVGFALWAVVIVGVLALAVLTGSGLGEAVGLWEATGAQPPIQSWYVIYETGGESVTVGFSVNGDTLVRYTVGV